MTELPSVENFICLLQKCRKKKDLAYAKRVHAHICNNGLEVHRALGNYIVPMFAECGSLSDAQQVFDKLIHRNEHSWTSLISGYTQCGQSQHALNLHQKMQEESVQPSSFTLVPLLKACVMLKDVKRGRGIHEEIMKKEFERDFIVGNAILRMYAKCGSFSEAWEVFDKLPRRDVETWNAVIAGYMEHGPLQQVLKCYEQMQLEGVSPNAVSFVCVLKVCGSIGAIDQGQEIYMQVTQEGFERDLFVGSTLVGMYAKCGSVSEAQEVFDMLPAQDVVSWNALLAGYAELGPDQKALKCFEKMQLKGISPNIVTIACILRLCGSKGALDKGQDIHREITQNGFEGDVVVSSALVDMYAKCGSLSEAQDVFTELPVRDVLSWNALLGGYVEYGRGQEALNYFRQMQADGIPPDAFTFVCILKACGSIGDVDRGLEIHSEVTRKGFEQYPMVGNTLVDMYAKCSSLAEALEIFDKLQFRNVVSWNALIAGYVEHGSDQEALRLFECMQLEVVSPDAVTFIYLLKACCSMGAIGKGQKAHMEITQKGLENNLFVGSALVGMYAKCGSTSEAREVFDKLPVRRVVSWTALIAGYAEHGPGQEGLKCFEQMQLDGIPPDAVTFVCALRTCGSIGDLDKGRELHREITERVFEQDPFVGNSLVDMYAKCASLAEAWEVFANLPVRDAVSLNALIAGYAEHGPGQGALKCFEQIQLEGMAPDAVTFVCMLKACGSIGALDQGREMHIQVMEKGFGRNSLVCNTLVDMYAKCGSLSEAQEVFTNLPVREVISWTSLIAGYAEHGLGQEALQCFEQMQLEGVSPNAVTLVCALKACSSIGSINEGQEIYTQITRKGFERDLLVGNTLIDMYVNCGSLSEAWEVLDKLPVRDVVSWNTLIAGYTEYGAGQEALKCFEQMQLEVVSPDAGTFVSALKACGSIGAIDKGREIFVEITQKEFERNSLVGNTLVDMYAKCDLLSEAREVFDKLPAREVVSWNTLIAGYVEHGLGQEALKCFEHMQLEGVSPSAVTLICLLKACCSIGARDKGQEIHMEITQKGFERDLFVGSTLVSMYAKCGLLLEAWKVFDELPVQEVVSWTAIIAGYAEHGPGDEALNYFEEMRSEGVLPNAVSFVCALKACGSVGAIDKGREVYIQVTHNGLESDLFVGSTLVDMYGKCGSISEAQEVFTKLPIRDVVSWNALIEGYAVNNEGNMALQCFEDMQEQGVKPNAVTFTCLLTACSHSSLVFKGQQYFKKMKEYSIAPTIDQYTCMVDLLARSGHLNEAEKFLETIPCPLSEETWRSLLSGCKNYGDTQLGLRCFQQLVQMTPEDAAAYVLMEGIYASAGRWDDAYKIEELRKLAGAKKKPANALIEVDNKVHEFVVGHDQSKQITATLEILSSRLKDKGHVPNLDL